MKWSIEPSDGVTNNGNGSFTFPEDSSITQYTVICDNEAGCTATTIYNIPQDCDGKPPTPPTPPGPEPDDPTCCEVIVDGHEGTKESAKPETGYSWSDSSYITSNGRFRVIIYDANSGALKESGDSTSNTGTVKGVTVSITRQGASFWNHSKCVGANLLYRAGKNDDPKCSGHGCSWSCYNSNAHTCDEACYFDTTPYNFNDPNLGIVKYSVGRNTSGYKRRIEIYWYPQGQSYDKCPSRVNKIIQDA